MIEEINMLDFDKFKAFLKTGTWEKQAKEFFEEVEFDDIVLGAFFYDKWKKVPHRDLKKLMHDDLENYSLNSIDLSKLAAIYIKEKNRKLLFVLSQLSYLASRHVKREKVRSKSYSGDSATNYSNQLRAAEISEHDFEPIGFQSTTHI